MSFQQGLSGLNAATKSLEAIGNNVANSGTVGFKQSQVQFSDIYASTLTGSGAAQIGIGTQVARVAQLFSQGNVTLSNNPLDMAINGNGFFRMDTNGAPSYTRNGQFTLSKEGFIENASGGRLTGFLLDANGIPSIGPSPLIINKADLAPQATTTYDLSVKLDSGEADKTAADFNHSDSTTYTHSTSVPVYDSQGNSHILSTYYVKTAANQWSVFASADNVPIGYDPAAVPPANAPVALGTMTFGSGGALTTNPSTLVVPIAVTTGAAPLSITLDHKGSQQFAGSFGVSKQLPNGYAAGMLASFSVSNDGMILGRYTNGQSNILGQVALTNFENPNGLQNVGNNQWVETAESGRPRTATPQSTGLGSVQSSRVEESNVDLTAELVNMITAQRVYQANAQTIKTQDQILQTLVNLR
ncbi:flagellar hook protein FlgE [Herminiimonas sp. NPDC097707]|uniref:flagellar hook protein FlgE n=1 Tax=Herminiimonas sp. NPDC097707 TaxID=3364007 RepID=UPI00383BCCB0